MRKKTLAKYIYDLLIDAKLPDVELNAKKQSVKVPNASILSLKKNFYKLSFTWYSFDDLVYSQRERYSDITFPKNFDIRNYIFFKRTGSYKLSYEQQFKKIINPLEKEVKSIKISPEYKSTRFNKGTLTLPLSIFIQVMNDAKYVYKKSSSYRNSTANYLANLKSNDYSNDTKKRTTYLERGEFSFLVDRLYLKSKRRREDFLKYLDSDDISAVETLITELLKFDVLSDDFLRKLNEYLIRERLKDIIKLGKTILSLKTSNLDTQAAKNVLLKMDIAETRQLESVWQKYFEKNLLYLIFTYKKVFPKVQLKDIEGDKKYPDFIGINHYNGVDIIEIKTHLKNALIWDKSHKNFYFSPEMSKAIVQTTNYLDAVIQVRFQNQEDRRNISQFTDEENLYHPRGIIIISSKDKLTVKKDEKEKLTRDFTKLRNSLHNIEILTFDEIINIADEYIKNIVPETSND